MSFESLLRASVEKTKDDFIIEYQEIRNNPLFVENSFETHLNDVRYYWLLGLDSTEKAIEIFELNKNKFPHSWNAFDGLAEAYEKSKNSEKAILNYKRAIDLNSNEEYKTKIKAKIEKLKK